MTICDRSILKIFLLLSKKTTQSFLLHRHIIIYTKMNAKIQRKMCVHNLVTKSSFVKKNFL
ncbi:MAG: hypothetical protein ACKPKO_11640 [Candidatus Fonsibacter sp.]